MRAGWRAAVLTSVLLVASCAHGAVQNDADWDWRTMNHEDVLSGSEQQHYHRLLADNGASNVTLTGSPCHDSFQCRLLEVCRNSTCGPCITNRECRVSNSKNICTDGQCIHKGLFFPFDLSDFFIALIALFTVMLSAPAGAGGGGVLVPIYIVIGQFSARGAIPLSKATIMGGAIANNISILRRRHPSANRPMVDFNVALILEPLLLMGTVIGVFFNAVAPGWLIAGILIIFLLISTFRTAKMAIATYYSERLQLPLDKTEEHEESSNAELPSVTLLKKPEEVALSQHAAKYQGYGATGTSSGAVSPLDLNREISGESRRIMTEEERENKSILHEILESESQQFNWKAIGLLVGSWMAVAVSSTLKGGEGSIGVAACGSPLYWFLVALPLPIVLSIVIVHSNFLRRLHRTKLTTGFKFYKGDVFWTRWNTYLFPLVSILAGFCSGALGIASGTVLAPIMLELGLLPTVATSTSGFMVLFTSSATTMQFVIMGQLQADYALFFAAVGFLGAGLGNTFVTIMIKKYRKTWFLICMLTLVIGLSTILMAVVSILREVQAINEGEYAGFHALCRSSEV